MRVFDQSHWLIEYASDGGKAFQSVQDYGVTYTLTPGAAIGVAATYFNIYSIGRSFSGDLGGVSSPTFASQNSIFFGNVSFSITTTAALPATYKYEIGGYGFNAIDRNNTITISNVFLSGSNAVNPLTTNLQYPQVNQAYTPFLGSALYFQFTNSGAAPLANVSFTFTLQGILAS